ncbi:MAG: chemotaxis protein MotB [Deinococcus-Thermus bacterium]|jgi:chemotaxis protein MotB|nr:chemotaxis protein MotB [Deinococcota bacterium]
MGASGNARPIVRRKKVVAEAPHHGGAWKVAYADFVTAMMAFFLLMWLLNATTEKQRKGLADHFSPTIPINRSSGGGDGALGGDSIFAEETLAQSGVGATSPDPFAERAAETRRLADLEDRLLGRGGEALLTENEMRHIQTRITDAGLVVEIFSLPGARLFAAGDDTPTALFETLIDTVGRLFARATNRVAIDGFSRAEPVVLARNPVWDRSLSRAERARAGLAAHVAGDRIVRVTGHADRDAAVDPPMAVRNDRLELTLLRRAAE